MLNFLNDRRYRFILLLPLAFLILNAVYFRYATVEIQKVLLNEKYIGIENEVDMLAAAVNANPERYWVDHEDNIRDSVEFLDKLHQIYAGLYKFSEGQLTLISERFFETTPIEPLDFIEFRELVSTQEHGKYIVGYTPETQTYRELYLYFRWMPGYSPEHERYLVIAGVSKYSIATNVALWVAAGQWASMAITFVLNVWLVLLITRLGSIYDKRTGEKWRKEPVPDDKY